MSKTNSTSSSPQPPQMQYEPMEYCLVRTPLLPIEAYLSFSQEGTDDASLLLDDDPRVRYAIAVGSLALLDELERQSSGQRDVRRRTKKLLRYLIRMSTRPTPYGLFAGVALGRWGEKTDLELEAPMDKLQIRPDMAWLMPLIWRIEALLEVRQYLCFVANSATLTHHGRVYLLENVATANTDTTQVPSVRATRAVQHAMRLARWPISYTTLYESLLTAIEGATPQQVETLIAELWKQGLLLTDLRPAMTGTPTPAWQLQARIAAIPALAGVASELGAILQAIQECELASNKEGIGRYRELTARMHEFQYRVDSLAGPATLPLSAEGETAEKNANKGDDGTTPALQVDMEHRLAGIHLSEAIRDEVARMADLLLRFSSFPSGMPALESFREAFIDRYGTSREVPLLEVLNPHFGLGDPAQIHKPGVQERLKSLTQRRDKALLQLALTAFRERQLVVELDEDLCKQLETPRLDTIPLQTSLDLNVFVVAASAEALDAGAFQIVLGPNFGAMQAGNNFGRFATLVSDDLTGLLRGTQCREEQMRSDVIWAEMVYLPYRARPANVALRPALRQYEIVFGASPNVAEDRVIPVNELVLGLRDERFYVRWPEKQTDVVICAGHMLNTNGAPSLVRFLDQLNYDKVRIISAFSWGEASDFPVLPRIQSGRVVLSLARWHLTTLTREKELPITSPAAFQAALHEWRTRWQVPRYVYLAHADNRLLLDLDDPQQNGELRTELQDLKEGAQLTLEEALPGPEQTWVKGPGGHYMLELNVPLLQRVTASAPRPVVEESPAAVQSETVPLHMRSRAPGSDWLFMKLYCSPEFQEDLIAGPVQALARDVIKEGLANDWFFIRYADPDPHVRLRFRGEPERLVKKLMPVLCDWGTWLMQDGPCIKFTFDVYEREIERYGGPETLGLAERIFGIDSQIVAELLALKCSKQLLLAETLLATLSTDHLLMALGATDRQRREWYTNRVTNRKEIGPLYREHSRQLRSLIGSPQKHFASMEMGEQLCSLLMTYRTSLAPIVQEVTVLHAQQKIRQPLAAFYASFVHMHCNRLFGINRQAEERTIGLLVRTYEGLERAPYE